MTVICVQVNDALLKQLADYAKRHQMSIDFVTGVAIDQFLSDPDNHFEPLEAAS